MKVGCLNLAYLSIDDQRSKIRQMTSALNLIKNDCSIVKVIYYHNQFYCLLCLNLSQNHWQDLV